MVVWVYSKFSKPSMSTIGTGDHTLGTSNIKEFIIMLIIGVIECESECTKSNVSSAYEHSAKHLDLG